ncbi:MAG: polysaccharide deacetylase family protein [Verrucomicrobia bacterium]|nr:polysaccharide deacetylase family protein [Prolixibacteraceae bacterium]
MRSICLCFHVHQPVRLKKFTFFDIGNSDYYYDDSRNETIIKRVSENCYMPANKIILDLINKSNGRFKVSYSISGTALEQFDRYAPEVLESFKELACTGHVEFMAQTYSHSLSFLKSKHQFASEIQAHGAAIESLFGKKPEVFSNTGLIYSDEIGTRIAAMGYKATLCGSPNHILQWRSPNQVYRNANNPAFSVLLKNQQLSDDLSLRFSNNDWIGWPLTAKKYVSWLNKTSTEGNIINLFMDYETFGEYHRKESGIFDFLDSFPRMVFAKSDCQFITPSQVVDQYPAISTIHVPYSHTWGDNQWNLSACLGNELQQEAFEQLYALNRIIDYCTCPKLKKDWQYLQSSDHFYYMTTNSLSVAERKTAGNPYESPYAAFINYMNVLNDFTLRLKRKTGDIQLHEYVDKREEISYTIL